LDCVVFGRVAGTHCAKYMLGNDVKKTSLIELSGGGLTGDVQASKNAGGSYEDDMNKGKEGGGGAEHQNIQTYSNNNILYHYHVLI